MYLKNFTRKDLTKKIYQKLGFSKSLSSKIIETAKKILDEGLQAIPHLPARTIKNFHALEKYIGNLSEKAGCKKILVIGGGANQLGEINSSLEVLETDLLSKFNYTTVGLAGHPNGHPDLNIHELDDSIIKKSTTIDVRTPFDNKVIEWIKYITKKKKIDINDAKIIDYVNAYGHNISNVMNYIEIDSLSAKKTSESNRVFYLWHFQDSIGKKKLVESIDIYQSFGMGLANEMIPNSALVNEKMMDIYGYHTDYMALGQNMYQ